jgi:SAM-dependent methyltransferase
MRITERQPEPQDQRINAAYLKEVDRQLEGMLRIEETHYMAHVGDVKRLVSGGRVADIGCGSGELAVAFAAAGFESSGIDDDVQAISAARNIYGDGNPRFINESVYDFTCTGQDAIVSTSALHHFNDLNAAFRRIYQNLSDGGIFWFTDISRHALDHIPGKIARLIKERQEIGDDAFMQQNFGRAHHRDMVMASLFSHMAAYIPEEVENALMASGFSGISIETGSA